MKLVGTPGSPKATREALLTALKGAHWPKVSVTLVGPWQGDREGAVYAVFVFGTPEPMATYPVFGPGQGAEGVDELMVLLKELQKRGVQRLYEAALAPGRLAELAQAGPEIAEEVFAARNPADPGIWRAA